MLTQKMYRILKLCMTILVIFLGVGCSNQHLPTKHEENVAKISVKKNNIFNYITKPTLPESKDVSVEEYESAIKKVNELSNVEGIDSVIIKVNDKKITKRTFETEKIMKGLQYSIPEKDILYFLIRPLVLNSEAERLDIEPSQDSINNYVNNIKDGLESGGNGMEYAFAYINAKGITTEEYLEESRKTAYDMFQREALYKYAESLDEYDNIEEYINDLINKAEIIFYDSEIEKICNE